MIRSASFDMNDITAATSLRWTRPRASSAGVSQSTLPTTRMAPGRSGSGCVSYRQFPSRVYDSCLHPNRPLTATASTRARRFCSAATTLTSCSLPAARGTRATTCTFPSSAYKNEWLTYILPQRNHRLERHRPRPAQPRLVVGERRGARHAVERRDGWRWTCNVPSRPGKLTSRAIFVLR